MIDSLYPYQIPLCDFPSDVLKWMKINAVSKPRMAVKLMKCRKCFQHCPEFPYWVTLKLKIHGNKWNFVAMGSSENEHLHEVVEDVERATKKITSKTIKKKRKLKEGDTALIGQQYGYEEYKDTKKFWIIGYLCLQNIPDPSSQFFPKIAICDIQSLTLLQQNLTFNQFNLLITSGNVTEMFLSGSKILYENGDPVFIDSILKCVPKLTLLQCYNYEQPFIPDNFVESMENFDASKIETFSIDMFSYYDFKTFKQFIEKNRHIFFEGIFADNSLSPEETEYIASFVQDVINVGSTEYPPIMLLYPDQPEEQRNAIGSLYDAFLRRNEL